MFISHKYKLLFFEVPRTASRSISQALTELDPESPTVAKRGNTGGAFSYHSFKSELLEDESYRVIATHRNPYERLWSFWKHRKNTGNPEILKTINWPTYVDWVCEPKSVPVLKRVMRDTPIAEMFDLERVNFWLDFNDLKQSWERLAPGLDLSLPPLRFVNASPDLGTVSDAYGPSMARRVQERFAQDFEFFNYDPDSWKATGPTLPDLEQPRSPAKPAIPNHSPKPRVVILSTFVQRNSASSLQRVVQDQLAMFVKYGYDPVLLVVASEYWLEPEELFGHERVRIVQYPAVKWIQPEGQEEAFLKDVERLREALHDTLADADVVLSHDVIYMPVFLKLSIACRQIAQDLPELKWLHWIHSATEPAALKKKGIASYLYADVLSQKWPSSYPVYFNRMSIPRIARNFNYEERDVKIVPHPTNITSFLGLEPLTTRLYEQKRLYLADHLCVVPVRLDRGKQVEWNIKIMACLKALGECVRIIVMDFHSQAEEKKEYREELKAIGKTWGLDEEELTFVSEFDSSLVGQSPHSMVRELFSLATVFIQPSQSESYSLITQEAALCGNLLILNDDFPPMREMFGEQALYFQFSSNIDRISLHDGVTQLEFEPVDYSGFPPGYPQQLVSQSDGIWRVAGDAAHANYIAQRIRYEFSNNIVLKQRQRRLRDRNLYSVFNWHLEPLILGLFEPRPVRPSR